jgi:hypothetical protein
MKNVELRIAIENLNLIKQVKLNGSMTLDLNTNMKNLSEADKLVEETRLKLCQDLCERRDPVGDQEIGEPIMIENVFQFSAENSEKINKEYTDLLNREAEVNIVRFEEEELKKIIKGIKEITSEQTNALLYFSKKF